MEKEKKIDYSSWGESGELYETSLIIELFRK
jgi:hypothetical protein